MNTWGASWGLCWGVSWGVDRVAESAAPPTVRVLGLSVPGRRIIYTVQRG